MFTVRLEKLDRPRLPAGRGRGGVPSTIHALMLVPSSTLRALTPVLLVAACLSGCSGRKSLSPSQPPRFVLTIGGALGFGTGQFRSPNGITVDAVGNVYVLDAGNHRVQKFSNTGKFLIQWGTEGTGNGQFYNPGRIAAAPSGSVYVTEAPVPMGLGVTRVQQFTWAGEYEASWGSSGSDTGQFKDPIGIAAGASGSLYITDVGNHRIQVFTKTGQFIRAWGDSGTGPGQFQYALELAVDRDENVFVVDVGPLDDAARIQKFKSDGSFVLQFGSIGPGEGQFAEPKGIAVDFSGNVYVADGTASRILKFTNDGVFVTQWGTFGFDPGQLNYPFGVATFQDRDVFVLEPFNNRVSKFSYAPESAATLVTAPEQ